jgi:hypothetical protein
MLQEVLIARKRCVSLGEYLPFKPEYTNHGLAACVDNYLWLIFEGKEGRVEHRFTLDNYELILELIYKCCKKINEFIDLNYIKNDSAAKYWLEVFLHNIDCICDFTKLQVKT